MQIPFFKQCSKCKQTKLIIEFNKNVRYKDGYVTWCKSCMAIANKESQARNAEKIKKRNHEMYLQNKSKINERNNTWCRNHWHTDPEYRERKNKQKKELLVNNPAYKSKMNEWKKSYNKARRKTDEQFAERCRESVRKNHHMRRAVIHGNGEKLAINPKEWDALCAKYDYRCLACGQKKTLEIDHIVPISKGGSNSIDNVQPLCRSCNSKKHVKTIDYRKNWGGG